MGWQGNDLYEIGGVDLSYYQDPTDFNTLSPLIDFAIVRVGDGYSGIDTKFHEYWAALKARRKPRGSYWYFRPDVSPVQQANWVAQAMGDDWGEMEFYADLETASGMDADDVTSVAIQFFAEVEKHNKLTYPDTGIYTSPGWWNDNIIYSRIPRLNQRSRWVAIWPTSGPRTRPMALPAGMDDWDVWQFTCKGHNYPNQSGDGKLWGVGSFSLDADVSRLTSVQFSARYGGTPNPDPDPDPTGVAVKYWPATTVNVRNAPSVKTGKVIATLRNGNGPFPVLGTEKDEKGQWWVKLAGGSVSAYCALWLGRVEYEPAE